MMSTRSNLSNTKSRQQTIHLRRVEIPKEFLAQMLTLQVRKFKTGSLVDALCRPREKVIPNKIFHKNFYKTWCAANNIVATWCRITLTSRSLMIWTRSFFVVTIVGILSLVLFLTAFPGIYELLSWNIRSYANIIYEYCIDRYLCVLVLLYVTLCTCILSIFKFSTNELF